MASGVNFSDPHDVDNTYSWTTSGAPHPPNGTTFIEFLVSLNGSSSNGLTPSGCFTNHCDWRLPTVFELRTISLYPSCSGSPCLDPIFGPTAPAEYSTLTTYTPGAQYAWLIHFGFGSAGPELKTDTVHVRAVRAGL